MAKTTPLDRAHGEVTRLIETVSSWEAEASAKRAELSDLEARIGDEVLADPDAAGRLTEQAARLRSEADVADRTADAARRQLAQARRDVLRAQAGELRGEARRLRDEAAKRQQHTDKLLADLAAHEGCDYVPFEPTREQVNSAGAAGVRVSIPRTRAMLTEADSFERRAGALERDADEAPAERVTSTVERLALPG